MRTSRVTSRVYSSIIQMEPREKSNQVINNGHARLSCRSIIVVSCLTPTISSRGTETETALFVEGFKTKSIAIICRYLYTRALPQYILIIYYPYYYIYTRLCTSTLISSLFPPQGREGSCIRPPWAVQDIVHCINLGLLAARDPCTKFPHFP
jgi:hypothetical protein